MVSRPYSVILGEPTKHGLYYKLGLEMSVHTSDDQDFLSKIDKIAVVTSKPNYIVLIVSGYREDGKKWSLEIMYSGTYLVTDSVRLVETK